ncbi:hypothetical protein AB1Y20_000029 [Prymnesium parvum]|uniref:Uncharacterized protein n=1 Tax=Prymnesium parvum TaxID=97485 RepID=A0AB34K7A3_PRYPA
MDAAAGELARGVKRKSDDDGAPAWDGEMSGAELLDALGLTISDLMASSSSAAATPPPEDAAAEQHAAEPVFGPEVWRYEPRPRLRGELEELNDLFVLDETSDTVMIPSLFIDRRILLVFLRHFGCRFCRQQVRAICEHAQPALRREGIPVVMISLGLPRHITKFKQETGIDAEIYVDPRPDSPVAYSGFKLYGGKDRMVDASGEVLPQVKEKALALPGDFYDGGYPTDTSPYSGDIFQVGGMFVMEGHSCLYAHRSAFLGDVPELPLVVEAATGKQPDGQPSTRQWPGWHTPCDDSWRQPLELPALVAPMPPPLPRVASKR